MSKDFIPGAIYSLILAIAAWAIEYFTEGPGSGVPWAPILVATIPILLKSLTVQGGEQPTASSRSVSSSDEWAYSVPPPPRSKMEKFLYG